MSRIYVPNSEWQEPGKPNAQTWAALVGLWAGVSTIVGMLFFALSQIGSAIDSYNKVATAYSGSPEQQFKAARRMSDAELKRYRTTLVIVGEKQPVRIVGLSYDNRSKNLNMKIGNDTDQDKAINAFVLQMGYQISYGAKLLPQDAINLEVSDAEARRAKAAGEPFAFTRGFRTSYVIPAKKVEAYDLTLNLSAGDLFVPPGATEGSHYKLNIKLLVEDKVVNNFYRLDVENGEIIIRPYGLSSD